MLALLLALACAATYGIGDFCGGLASRRAAALSVLSVSTPIGVVGLVVAALLSVGSPSARDLLAGAGAGLAGAGGVALLYRGLAAGRMQVVAPLSAVGSAVVPVLVGVALGERPGLLAWPGTVLALLAVVLISGAGEEAVDGDERRPRAALGGSVTLGLGAGVAFGLFFVALGVAHEGAGLWPLVTARSSSTLLIWAFAAATRAPLRPARPALPLTLAAGALDTAANVLFVAAVHAGLLSIVSVVVALYPAGTVLLAAVVLGERVRRLQGLGLVTAAAGVVLIAGA